MLLSLGQFFVIFIYVSSQEFAMGKIADIVDEVIDDDPTVSML